MGPWIHQGGTHQLTEMVSPRARASSTMICTYAVPDWSVRNNNANNGRKSRNRTMFNNTSVANCSATSDQGGARIHKAVRRHYMFETMAMMQETLVRFGQQQSASVLCDEIANQSSNLFGTLTVELCIHTCINKIWIVLSCWEMNLCDLLFWD